MRVPSRNLYKAITASMSLRKDIEWTILVCDPPLNCVKSEEESGDKDSKHEVNIFHCCLTNVNIEVHKCDNITTL